MPKCLFGMLMLLAVFFARAQNFVRTQLPTVLDTPWEIVYGPDGFLWLTEKGGKVSRVDPTTGAKTVVYSAPDYFGGSPLEKSILCFKPDIGAGTLGLALHPDFMNPANAFIYFVYSYNSGSTSSPATKFKIERLTWNSAGNSVISNTTLVSSMPTGYDHLGGRLMIIPQNNVPYLFFTVGDNGISETNDPACYSPQTNNPNNNAQSVNFKNGKIHRFHLDGSVPSDNPIPNNSFYTRGHRNPQGLMYNPIQNVIYNIEHGDRTDDEINILEAGMNYGWKNVRGYHNDNNYPGEANYITTYSPNTSVLNDALKEPIYAWCSTTQPTISAYMDWCTVAPSDGIYYGSSGIPDWTNSLLVVTLKNGSITDQELYCFKLNTDGKSLAASTSSSPNPMKFFESDQDINGRLRDIAISPDGKKIYLINNGGKTTDGITIYEYTGGSGLTQIPEQEFSCVVYPNPSRGLLKITCTENLKSLDLLDVLGEHVGKLDPNSLIQDVTNLSSGSYYLKIETASGRVVRRRLIIGID